MCPFREYTKMAQKAPKGTVTITTMRDLLVPLKVSQSDIGGILFALDTKNVGYVRPEKFVETFPKVMEELYPETLTKEQVQDIVDQFAKSEESDEDLSDDGIEIMKSQMTEILSA